MDLKPTTPDGKCSNCGSADMMLARDMTDYTACTFDDGVWERGCTDTQATEAHDAVRFFCTECGEGHEVPEALA